LVASTAVSMVPWPAHHDHRHRQLRGRAPLLEQRDAVDVGHPDVEQDEVGPDALAAGARLRGVLRELDRVAFVGEDLRQQRPNPQFVVDDKNGGHELSVQPRRGDRLVRSDADRRCEFRK
jgi:hypothetical protein